MKAKNPYLFPRPLPTGAFSPNECLAILEAHSGTTLLDYFAGQALPALIALHDQSETGALDATTFSAYEYADAMLKARKKFIRENK